MVFSLGLRCSAGCLLGLVPRLDHRCQRPLFITGVALDRLDNVGDQIVPALELNVDIAPRAVTPHPQRNEVVVDRNQSEAAHQQDKRQTDKYGRDERGGQQRNRQHGKGS